MKSILRDSLEREIRTDKLIHELSKHTVNSGADSQRITELANLLQPFLGSIFNALEVAMKLSKHPQFGRAVSFATGQIVQYCFDEEDLFPERDYGILGLLDDAYLIHRFVSMLQEMYSHVGMDDAKYRLPEKPIFELVQTVLPAGVCDALDRYVLQPHSGSQYSFC